MSALLLLLVVLAANSSGTDSNTRPTADAQLESSNLAIRAGDYAKAIRDATTAQHLFQTLNDRARASQAANNVGLAHLYQAQYNQALQSFEQALQLNAGSVDRESEVSITTNIGNIHFFQGRYQQALDSYQSALRAIAQSSSQPWAQRRKQLGLVNLGVLYEQLGQNSRALNYYREANVTPTALTPAEQAQMLVNLGTLYRRLGDAIKAMETYTEARRWSEREKNVDGQINALHNIGILLTSNYADTPGALRAFDQAIALATQTHNKRQTVLGRLFRAEALRRAHQSAPALAEYAAALAGAREISGREEQWSALYGIGLLHAAAGNSARAQDVFRQAITVIEGVRAGLGRSSLKADFLANKRDVYDALIDTLATAPNPDPAPIFQLMEQARARNLQDRLQPSPTIPTLAQVQQRLAPNQAVLEFWTSPQHAAALWITNREVRLQLLNIPEHLAVAIDHFDQAIDTQDWRALSRELGAALLPNLPLHSANSLTIIPDGPLQRIPFELAVHNDKLLLETHAVSYLPAAALLLRHPRPSKPTAPWTPQLAAFGDPAMPPAAAPLGARASWQPLPYASTEMREVASILPGAAKLFARSADLKSAFLTRAATPILHLATHAAVDLENPARSRILFTREPAQSGSEYLFWREIESLDLTATDLVTLSACDTEGGKLAKGEGVLSFGRAFLSAGARSTVTTLWRVADQPTAELMKQFYFRLAKGETKSEALRQAKLSFLHSNTPLNHPKHWAPFILTGEGQTPIPNPIRYSHLMALIAAIALVAFILVKRIGKPKPMSHFPPPSRPDR